ncbi:Putative two-component sensor histidine kinase, classical system [Magnetospirillum molischianum DSM 120]|uniref:histidine kinase n=2 Tax=Magnetospirillum molischianum TaxID=1083 RepID=H8FQG7_MAGML|nr:Putative two-component sensor histidine kinase, classical system [Magnetospirillum molischianum DSM 120]
MTAAGAQSPVDLHRAAFTMSSRPLALLGPDGRLSDANSVFCTLVRRDLASLVGTSPDWIDPWRDGRVVLSSPDGSLVEVSLALVPLPGGGTLIDLDPWPEARQRAAERAHREMRAIIENAYEFIGLLSPEGYLLDANRTAMSFINCDDLDVLRGRPFADTPWWAHSSEERAQLIEAIQRARQGEFVRFETSHRGRDGQLAYVDFSLKPVTGDDGAVIYLVPEGRDITQRKRAEDELIAAKLEAESANRAKSNFLASVSHELRTPLNAVIGFSEALLSDALGPLEPERMRDYLRLILAAGQHLGALVEDILDVSRVELGHIELAEDVVSPDEMVDSIRRLFDPYAIGGSIRLTVALPSSVPRLRADSRRLRHVLLNLVANAIKFTPAGGSVTIRVTVGPEGMGFHVEDTGIGIPAEYHGKVWQPFFQSDAQHARPHDGAGLGLAIVKRFVEALSGQVSLDSSPGQGTRVSVLLPPERVIAP